MQAVSQYLWSLRKTSGSPASTERGTYLAAGARIARRGDTFITSRDYDLFVF